MVTLKRCTKCGEAKPLEKFSPDRRHRDGQQSQCKTCRAKFYGRRYQGNKVAILEQLRRRYQENPEKKREQVRRWRRENPEKRAEIDRRWRQENPEKAHEYDHIKRIRRAGAEGSHAHAEFVILCELAGWRCLRCGRSHMDSLLTEDHIAPISRGGPDDISNIQPLCRHCNSVKSVKSTNYWQDPWWACVT